MMHFKSVLLLLLALKSAISTSGLGEIACNTIDVRVFKDLEKLENCTVITGSLHLLFGLSEDEKYTPMEVNSRSFPLREVTGFILFYDMTYLDSIGNLFPNLTVIRGQKLLSGAAFVIYETDIAELGLKSLLKIGRGSVRIGGYNKRLCLPKIDWDSIIMNGRLSTFGKNVTRSNCISQYDRCYNCQRPGYCWNNKVCQEIDHTFKVIGSKNKYCHPLCLGRCVDSTAKGCFACRDKSELGECVKTCSSSRYFNDDTRRCITADECINLGRVIYKRECLQNCPPGYTENMNYTEMLSFNHTCVPCEKKCPRVCADIPEIKTISQLEAIGIGCTIINGSLEIKLMDDICNVTAELQMYLGDIEEIHGNLKIHRSTPLTSLTFLNKLRVVHGKKDKPTSYSIRIFENANLQSIFDWRLRGDEKLEVKYGYIHIYNNNMLCESEIENFKGLLVPHDARLMDFMVKNGNERACRNDNIKTYSQVISHNTVEISWDDLLLKRDEIECRYILQYVPIENYEVKEFDENMLYERDSCSSFGWKNIIIEMKNITFAENDPANSTMVYKLTNLMQYTYYAFTIQRYYFNITDAMSNLTMSGASEVNIFQTLMNIPSRVVRFSSLIKTTNSIELRWDVVEKEKSAIDRILIYVFELSPSNDQVDARDYCLYPVNFDETPVTDEESETDKTEFVVSYMDDRCCERCCVNQKQNDAQVENKENDFGDSLIKFSQSGMHETTAKKRRAMKQRPGFMYYISLNHDVRSFTVSNLTAYTTYAFQAYVCSSEKCSDYELLNERTAMNGNFDRIDINPVNNEFYNNEFSIYFDEPHHRNGAIVSYVIEVNSIKENVTHPFKMECITRLQHAQNGYRFSISKMPEGSYVFRISAVSLAQRGPFTDWHHFKVVMPKNESHYLRLIIVILLSIGITTFAGIAIICYRKLTAQRQDDTLLLMTEMESFNFDENQMSSDRLSDIAENDE